MMQHTGHVRLCEHYLSCCSRLCMSDGPALQLRRQKGAGASATASALRG